MKTCVFAGTFDPVSRGHEFIINKCLELFDKVVVAVGVNADKTPLFSLEERIELIKATVNSDRVEVTSFSGMLSQSICFPACKFCCCWLGKCHELLRL